MAGQMIVEAACHCRRVRFEATLTDGLDNVFRCNCSFCRMRGAVVVSAESDGVRIISGEDALIEYQFNSRTAKHYFCSVCGIYTASSAAFGHEAVRCERGLHRRRQPPSISAKCRSMTASTTAAMRGRAQNRGLPASCAMRPAAD